MTITEEAPVMTDPALAGSATHPDPAKGGKGKGKAGKDKGPKGRSNLVPALVLAAGVAAGGYFMGGGGGSASGATEETPVTVVEPEPGEMVRLKAMTVNLADGRFLRLGVAFQMTEDFEAGEGSDGAVEFTSADEGRLRDLLIAMFSGRDGGTLIGPDDRDQVKVELLEGANAVLDGQVMSVYLTELVMQ